MEDSIEVILQEFCSDHDPHPVVSACSGVLLSGVYGLWSLFVMPGFRKVPWNLKLSAPWFKWKQKKRVPYLPSSKAQTMNAMKLLEGRTGRLADLGSGDGRLVFAASAAGFQCTGFEINSILVTYSRTKAYWSGLRPRQAEFVNKDFWKTDLSSFQNVTAFLGPRVMEVLEGKLLQELPDDARVIACRFPFPTWPPHTSRGSGLDETFAYDVGTVREHLRKQARAQD